LNRSLRDLRFDAPTSRSSTAMPSRLPPPPPPLASTSISGSHSDPALYAGSQSWRLAATPSPSISPSVSPVAYHSSPFPAMPQNHTPSSKPPNFGDERSTWTPASSEVDILWPWALSCPLHHLIFSGFAARNLLIGWTSSLTTQTPPSTLTGTPPSTLNGTPPSTPTGTPPSLIWAPPTHMSTHSLLSRIRGCQPAPRVWWPRRVRLGSFFRCSSKSRPNS